MRKSLIFKLFIAPPILGKVKISSDLTTAKLYVELHSILKEKPTHTNFLLENSVLGANLSEKGSGSSLALATLTQIKSASPDLALSCSTIGKQHLDKDIIFAKMGKNKLTLKVYSTLILQWNKVCCGKSSQEHWFVSMMAHFQKMNLTGKEK